MDAAKQHILAEIKRLAEANGGKPPGMGAFKSETGIRRSDWFPDLWLRWGDAQQEAGFIPNSFDKALTDEHLVEQYARLAQRLSHLPIEGELVREKKANASFPNAHAFRRAFGGKEKLLRAVGAFCRAHSGFDDVLTMCESAMTVKRSEAVPRSPQRVSAGTGFVYLVKSGKHHKIGHTNSIARRTYELGIKIPVPPRTIHYIETDDPVGIEAYWHKRFDSKRGEGEWFNLTAEDVAAFKRWKRIV